MFKSGDVCYFIISNYTVTQGKIKSIQGDFCTVIYGGGQKGIRLRKSRLYQTAAEAEAHCDKPKRTYRTHHDYE